MNDRSENVQYSSFVQWHELFNQLRPENAASGTPDGDAENGKNNLSENAKMLRNLNRSLLAVCVTVGLSASVQAQATCGNTGGAGTNCSPAGTQATTTVQRIVFMSITPAVATLTAPTNADFTAGGTTTKTDLAAQTVTVRANASWSLTIQGASWTGTGNNSKSVGDLKWSTTGGAPFTDMTTGTATLATGSATSGSNTTIGYQTAWALASDSPGTYVMALTFTLTAP